LRIWGLKGKGHRENHAVFHTRKVAEILLTARTDSHDFAVVLFEGGGYGISRDGDVVVDYHWPHAELDACIEVFMSLCEIEFEGPNEDDRSFRPHDRMP
jgi:hypothetical protein